MPWSSLAWDFMYMESKCESRIWQVAIMIKSKTDLPQLEFVQDNALNIARHGTFDAVICAIFSII